MLVSEIAKVLDAEVLTGHSRLEQVIHQAFASDLMSDVLVRDYEHTVLITGLSNIQSIRTAEMSDIQTVIIARNKQVTEDMIALARENDMVLLRSQNSLFKVSGELFSHGIKPVF